MITDHPFRVLIVDDDSVHRALEREIPQAPKYAVTEASSGAEALQLLASQSFDAVLPDKRQYTDSVKALNYSRDNPKVRYRCGYHRSDDA